MKAARNENELRDIAEKFYLNEEQPLSDDMEKYRAFIRGGEWVEKNPSDEMILRAVKLYAEASTAFNRMRIKRLEYNLKFVDSEGYKD